MGFEIRSAAKATHKQLIGKTAARRSFHADRTVIAAALASPAIVNDLVPELRVERVAIDQLKPAKRRIRKPGKNHLGNVARCIKTVGQVAPILIDREAQIVDGHVVVEALKLLRETHVNVVVLDHLDQNQLKLVQVALNKLTEGSDWELEELRPQLEDLQLVGYDLTATGFSLPEIDIITQSDPATAPEEQEQPLDPPAQPVTRLGDLWQLGEHRLLCGDALDEHAYAMVLGSRQADACFTDPPWNIPIEGFVSGLGATKHQDFKMGAGEMSDEAFQEFIDRFTRLIAAYLEDGGVMFACIDWRSHDDVVLGGRRVGLTHINTIVWNKGSGGMGGLYRSAHELIPLFCKGASPKTNNVELGRHGRDRTNVWSYAGANKPGSSAAKALKHHPTPKPVEMVEDALLDVTSRGEVVLDPFMGSGTTLLAAERTRRIAAGIELDPAYVDVCVRRWQDMTRKVAVHTETQLTFEEMAANRSRELIEEGENGDDD